MSRVRENRMHGSTGGDWKRTTTCVTAPVPDPTNLPDTGAASLRLSRRVLRTVEADRTRLKLLGVHAQSGDSYLESTLKSTEAAKACGQA